MKLTTSKAREILAAPLVFGNHEQIAAATFIEQVEDCIQAVLGGEELVWEIDCMNCNGKGVLNCKHPGCGDRHGCMHCDGTGRAALLDESISRFDRSVIDEALKSPSVADLREEIEAALRGVLIDVKQEAEERRVAGAGG